MLRIDEIKKTEKVSLNDSKNMELLIEGEKSFCDKNVPLNKQKQPINVLPRTIIDMVDTN